MRRCIVGAVAALLMSAGLITVAPPASAGCLYGGPFTSKCDAPSRQTAPGSGAWESPAWFPAAPVRIWRR